MPLTSTSYVFATQRLFCGVSEGSKSDAISVLKTSVCGLSKSKSVPDDHFRKMSMFNAKHLWNRLFDAEHFDADIPM